MNMRKPSNRNRAGRRSRGFSLIELMIAMVLGLIVIAGAGSVFMASSRTYQTNTALSEVQSNARISFELLARDLRMAGQNDCNNNGRVANVLNNQATAWYANWGNALHGYASTQADPAVATGSGVGERVAGTDSVQILGSGTTGLSVQKHNPTSATFFLNQTTTSLKPGDIIVVCDQDHTALTQITNYNSSNKTIVHNNGTGSPGNCSKGLGWPTTCTTNGNTYTFPPNSIIATLVASDWYIGNNPVGGRSLYKISMINSAGVPTTQAQEMVRNVQNMTIKYHQTSSNDYLDAAAVTNWAVVDSVQVTLQIESTDKRAGMNYTPITRNFTTTATIRNRVQ